MRERKQTQKISVVAIARRIHLYPCRTQKLSFLAPRVVGGRLPARIGRCHASNSGLAQLVERLTVNQDVVSSSLTTGVNQNRSVRPIFLVNEIIY